MIITENEGLNLNSVVVQNMIKDWPPEKLATTKFHYGNPPRMETVIEPFPSGCIEKEDQTVSFGMVQPNPSPYTMSVNNAYGSLLPTYNCTGAMATGPSYFDFGQPGGYVPQTTSIIPPVAQMQATGNFGYTPTGYMPNAYAPVNYNGFYNQQGFGPRPATEECVVKVAPPPSYAIMNGPGTIYSNVEYKMYPGVQEDHYNPLPSQSFLDSLVHRADRFKGYSNPFMPGFGMGIVGPNTTVEDAYRMARHNYAMQFGFNSLEEMEESDLSCLKTLSVIANTAMGMSMDDIQKRIHKVYEEPYQKKKAPTLAEQTKMVEDYRRYHDQFKFKIKVTLRRGDEVITEFDPAKNKPPKLDDIDFAAEIAKAEAAQANREYASAVMWANAMERKFDNYSMLQYFNDAFYDLHLRDLKEQDRRAKNALVKDIYNHEDFKREITAKFGRPAQRARLMEEDMRFRKYEDPPEGCIKGSYGKLPLGIQMDPKGDQRLGYCWNLNLETGEMKMQFPLSDEDLMERKNRFLRAAGCKVPLYATVQ